MISKLSRLPADSYMSLRDSMLVHIDRCELNGCWSKALFVALLETMENTEINWIRCGRRGDMCFFFSV